MEEFRYPSGSKRRKKRARQKRRNRLMWLCGIISFILFSAVFAGFVAFVEIRGDQEWPNIEKLKPKDLGQNSIIYARDGTVLGIVPSTEKRTLISFDELGKNLPNATIAVEDQRFYQHQGFDRRGIARALVRDIQTGDRAQGGSTITQQLVRNLYPEIGREKTVSRKSKELWLSYELEKQLTKDTKSKKAAKEQLLETYLNLIYFGRGAYGAEAASNIWFGIPANKLNVAQAATLAALIHSPARYEDLDLQSRQALIARRNIVIELMKTQKLITKSEYDVAIKSTLAFKKASIYKPYRLPIVFDYVQRELQASYSPERVRQGGLRVTTTISPRFQQIATQELAKNLGNKSDPAAAVVLIDNTNGDILALAGNRPYARSGFNLATQAVRQPGSSAKIWALAALVRKKVNPDNTYYSSYPLKVRLKGSQEVWEPKTYDGSYPGQMSLSAATVRSDNSIYAQLVLDLSSSEVAKTATAMGIKSPLQPVASIVLGSQGVTVLEQTNFYSTIARGGVRIDPTAIATITDPTGKKIQNPKRVNNRVMNQYQAKKIIDILERNVDYGTGTRARLSNIDVAGKTGTTDDYKDAWFCGMTPKITSCVWVGYERPKPMLNVRGVRVAGGTFPATIWHDVMERALKGTRFKEFKVSSSNSDWSGNWQEGAWRSKGEWE